MKKLNAGDIDHIKIVNYPPSEATFVAFILYSLGKYESELYNNHRLNTDWLITTKDNYRIFEELFE